MGKRHLEAYRTSEEINVDACCDARPEALKSLDDAGAACRRYSDWREMLREESFDILSVVTNGPSHAEITIRAEEVGIPRVLCEKPMATSVKDAKRMIEAAQTNGTRLAINYSRRWSHDYRRLKELIREGTIGDLCQFYCVCGGGLLACNGSHFFDLMRFLSDSQAVSALAYVDKKGTPNPRGKEFSDPGAFGIVRFENGMRGFVDMYEDLGVPPKIEIVGSIGRIIIDEVNNSWLIESREGKNRIEPLGKYDLPLVRRPFPSHQLDLIRLLVETIDEVLGEGPISCTGADGLAAVQMIIGFHLSDMEGNTPVPLPIPKESEELSVNFT
jgi:predicted dehydrogenase